MSDPGYDFFATGRPTPPPGAPAVPEPTVAAPPAAPPPVQYGAPAPARTFQMPNGTQVNQFGTPVGEAAAPTGPYAAPGVGAVPTATPGMVSTWSGPEAAPGHRAVPAPHRAAAPAGADRPPRNVMAVAVLAVFFGVLGALGTVGALLAYSTLSSQIDALGAGAELGGALLTAALIGVVVLAVVTATLLVGGIATLVGKRWGGWILVVAFGLSLLGQVQQVLSGSLGLAQVIGFLIGLVLLLVLVTGEGLAWLQGKVVPR
jgi:hypothetical protein